MTIIIILAIIVIAGLSVFGWFQYKARLRHEDIIVKMMYKVNTSLEIMRNLDLRGAFEAHDEVGEAFMLLTLTIEELRNYAIEQLTRTERNKEGKKTNT